MRLSGNDIKPFKLVLFTVAAGLLAFLLCFAAPLQFLLPFALAALGMALRPGASLGAALIGGALSLAFFGVGGAVEFLLWTPGAVLLPFLMRKKYSSLACVAFSAALMCIALWMLMLHVDAAKLIQELRGDFMNEAYAFAGQQGLTNEFADSLVDVWRPIFDYVELALPGGIISISLISALVMFVICRKIASLRGVEIAPFPPFARWQLPKGFTFGALLFFLAAELLPRINTGINGALPIALTAAVTVPLTVQGMCVVEFFLVRKNIHAAGRVAIIVALAVLAQIVLMFAGMFEQVLKLRKRADMLQK